MARTKTAVQEVVIRKPRVEVVEVDIVGTSPYVQNKLSKAVIEELIKDQASGERKRKGKKREPKDFDQLWREVTRQSPEGWYGIPAPAFRQAMVDACRLAGVKMTMARMSFFVEADGYDKDDGMPLVRITKGEPKPRIDITRIANGRTVNVTARPMWDPGWEARVRIKYYADTFSAEDIINLLSLAGEFVGIGEGRPFSPNSSGCGWGLFRVKEG